MTLKKTTRKSTKVPSRQASTPKAAAAGAASTSTPATARTARPARNADAARPVTFHYFAPQAGAVWLAGDFTQWESSPVQLHREEGGMWSTTVKLTPGCYEYRLLVDGQWQNDPHCSEQRPNQFGSTNCVCAVAA